MLRIISIFLFFCITTQVYSQTDDSAMPQGLKIGDIAPEFAAMDYLGNPVSLSELLQKGPVVLMFYRGVWCPYCNKQLGQMQDSLGLISDLGGTVVAVTPETVESIEKTVEKTNAGFRIIHDENLQIMKAYDVSFKMESELIAKYKKRGRDFNVINGENGANLPVPATYIINPQGRIIFAFFDPDYKKRATVAKILSHLSTL